MQPIRFPPSRGTVNAWASRVVAHDNQIEGLTRVGEQHNRELAGLKVRMDESSRECQAHLTTVCRPQ
jgi:hypothetical protein